jgi:hypothetical protein
MTCLPAVLCLSAGLLAWGAQAQPAGEAESLRAALADAGRSNVDFIRALDKHLAGFPKSEHRGEIEHAILKAAIETDDEEPIVT